jgi:uncharacterized membrane protein
MDGALQALTLVTALGCGLVAGFLFAFSSAVMDALARLKPPEGIAAMQSINVTVITPLFMLALFGTVVPCLVLAVVSVVEWGEPGAAYLLAGSLLYVVGTALVTIAFNVPRNDALAAVAAESAEGATVWARFVPSWTAWNTVRTVAAVAAAAALSIALVEG